ncbi:12-oxophytodienoate reductase 1 [Phytophthora pseudosyringae]|uniref:12-oxophytodienoate reductase 1 n=1 Tax=Phytophthora pseudosyringae TaxID=221518 RepID=A0A8T1V828_9STRA|nr:12-oxophytodienoate reductase 1 [Phytophthora pseudosyringae]
MEKYMRVQKAACPVTSVLIANNGISTVKATRTIRGRSNKMPARSTSEHVVKEPGSSHDYADRFDVEEVSSRAVLVSPGAELQLASSSALVAWPSSPRAHSSPSAPAACLAPTREGRLLHPVPRALGSDEIAGIVADYKSAALLAVDAGFDGVELHCANGYLMEQFLCDSVNKRTDRYGGSLENRVRILYEALEAVLSGVDSNKVGIRLSPYGSAFGCSDSAPGATPSRSSTDYDLVYLHLVEPRGIQVPAPDAPEGGELPIFRKSCHGVIITASGYDRAEAIKVAEDGSADCVASRLNKRNQKTVYFPLGVPFETGYTDYPFLADSKQEYDQVEKNVMYG